jgi:oligoendopeptidase F
VLGGYYAFSEETGKIAEQFFEKRWIDAEIREGKQGGGFCAETTPILHPYILVNYTGSLRDVLTVAHELGHGIHQYLARRAGILESSAPLTMAETASVFGEMLVFDKILEAEKDPKKRLALLCGKIDDNFATVFRQIVLTDFELETHKTGLAEGELTTEALGGLWMKTNAAFYGSSVKLTETYRSGWQVIPHFIHTPFYCYAYAFAQLFVLALFRKYREEGASFVPKYLEMLALGGSRKPEEIAKMAGLDLRDFWRSGLKILDELVKDAEALAKEEIELRQAQSDPLAAPRVRPARERPARSPA